MQDTELGAVKKGRDGVKRLNVRHWILWKSAHFSAPSATLTHSHWSTRPLFTIKRQYYISGGVQWQDWFEKKSWTWQCNVLCNWILLVPVAEQILDHCFCDFCVESGNWESVKPRRTLFADRSICDFRCRQHFFFFRGPQSVQPKMMQQTDDANQPVSNLSNPATIWTMRNLVAAAVDTERPEATLCSTGANHRESACYLSLPETSTPIPTLLHLTGAFIENSLRSLTLRQSRRITHKGI